MKTKTIFKTLAMAMMMPTMLLTTACSSDDDAIANNNETPAKKGYPLQVTVNVTRQGDNATTRATYTDNGNKTGSLSFSSGDQLFIYGEDENAGQFAGTLTWVSGETFSGTITTENSYSGTANDLFSSAGSASSDYYLIAELLPNGYEAYGFISITEKDGYDDELSENINNTFATTKALAVEQFSWEWTDEYDNGFALSPGNSILNFTISGLTASTEVNVALTGNGRNITGKVTTDGSGTATFAIGVPAGIRIEYYSLTVGGNAITLPEKLPEPAKIYNISRSVAPTLANTMTTAGMTVKVNYNYFNDNYCLFVSNGDGTYTFNSGGGYAGGADRAKALVVEGDKLVFKQNHHSTFNSVLDNYGFSFTFDTSNNTYTQWVGSECPFTPSFTSVEVNGTTIAVTPQ